MKKALSLTIVVICTILVFSSFDLKKEDLLGFWRYCETTDCIDSGESLVGLMVFEEDSCHSFIGFPDGLDPQLIGSSGYALKKDSLFMFERDTVFRYQLQFLNDSTFQMHIDSTEFLTYRRVAR